MSVLGFALFCAAWIGHSALWLVFLNVVYAQPLSRIVLRISRAMVAWLVVLFPLVLWAGAGIDLPDFPPQRWTVGTALLGAYLALCWLICLAVIPTVTLGRLLRTAPPHLVRRRHAIVDYAKALGRKPTGTGKFRRLAELPFNQVFEVEFTELTLHLPHLPRAWDGLTILQLSDLHFCGTPAENFFERVFAQCMSQGVPDLLVLTGDFVDTAVHHRWLLRLLSRLQWKSAAFAVLGNHDWLFDDRKIRRRLARLGITVLGNRWEVVPMRGEPLLVVGHEGPWFGPPPDLRGAPDQTFRLCLSHTPDNINWAKRHGIHLMLSGHCHGGQIRLPVFGSLFVPSKFSRRFDQGLFFEPPTLLYVNRGLSGKEPLRYLCRPEVTRFTLRSRKA